MKNHSAKKMLACLLSAVLLLLSVSFALAKTGPFEESYDGWYPAHVSFMQIDSKGEPVVITDENTPWGEPVTFPVWLNNETVKQTGAVYDRATNTLTLTDFNHPDYTLSANMMGDDFTLEIKGACALADIVVWGDGWGGSLHLTGDGSLKVNENNLFDSSLIFYPEGVETLQFSVAPQVKLDMTGKETAFEVYGYENELSVTVGNTSLPMEKKTAVREKFVEVFGYSSPWEENIRVCKNKADPDGVYSLMEWESDKGEKSVTVERFIHVEKGDLYLVDQAWIEETAGKGAGEVRFASLEEAAAAGFTPVKDANGENVWMTADSMGARGTEILYEAADGTRYVLGYGENDKGEYGEFAMTMEPIAEIPGAYLFTPAPDVDPEALTEVTETVTYDDVFDYKFPDKEFSVHIDMSILLGDVNGDGEVTSEDARYALRAAVGLDDTADGLDFSDEGNRCFVAANVDGEAGISAGDARLILRAAVGLENLG